MDLDFRETTCGDGSCAMSENSSTCPKDCPSGGLDEYCDQVKDGQCDPDCKVYEGSDPDCIMPLPTSQEAFGYSATKLPELDVTPSQAKPVGVGSVAVGGDTIDVIIELSECSGAADVYFGNHAPLVDPNIYILTSAFKLQPVAMGLYPWKEDTSDPIDETLFADIKTSMLPPGTYHLYLGVTPTGTINTFYLWSTEFVVP